MADGGDRKVKHGLIPILVAMRVQGERERRVTVRTGIETDEQVEILEGVEEGDVIVGQ